MDKFIEYNKLSKKEKRKRDKAMRIVSGFNTGTRVMKDPKHPSRAERKKEWQKGLDNY